MNFKEVDKSNLGYNKRSNLKFCSISKIIQRQKMQSALKLTTLVLPGGKIEVIDSQLPEGKSVDIIVLFSNTPQHSILDILENAPGHLVFQTAKDVDVYLETERNEWES